MKLGKVVGTVVATQKTEALKGTKLLVVAECAPGGEPMESYTVAIDAVGAGVDEIVLVVAGSSARITTETRDCPVDATIIAIVDTIEADGTITYRKHAG